MKQSAKRGGTKETQTQKPKMTKPANLTPEEAAVFQRVKGAGKLVDRWQTVREQDIDDFSLREDPMKLPEFAQQLQDAKVYAFRWVTRVKERLDEIRNKPDPFAWEVVNAATIPESVDDLDPVLGCVSKLDQLLVFQPYMMAEARQRIREGLAEGKRQSGDLEAKDGQMVADNIVLHAGKKVKIQAADEEGTDVVVGEEGQTFMAGESEPEGLDDLVAEE